MPINFVTGLPRQGKTLFAFIEIQRRAKEENRPVFYCNIPNVTLPGWVEIDHPDKWMECPNDSIIVVDELQDFWGAASSGAKVPEPILELSKHGKRGIDFYFITQDPTLVHNTPRKLTETHWYVVRAFGSQNAIAYKWTGKSCWNTPVAKAEKYPWRYPKEAFGKKDKAGNWITQPWYKSADVHNIKRKIPLKVWAIPFAILLGIGAVWFAVSSVLSFGAKAAGTVGAPAASASSSPGSASVARPPGAGAQVAAQTGPLTYEQYVHARSPRLPDFPQSAPVYDAVTQPTEAPYPAACVEMGKTCKCYSQQATLLQVSGPVCLQIVRQGFFMDWASRDEGASRHGQREREQSARNRFDETRQQGRERAVTTVPMPAPPVPQPGQITQADLVAQHRLKNPAFAGLPRGSSQ